MWAESKQNQPKKATTPVIWQSLLNSEKDFSRNLKLTLFNNINRKFHFVLILLPACCLPATTTEILRFFCFLSVLQIFPADPIHSIPFHPLHCKLNFFKLFSHILECADIYSDRLTDVLKGKEKFCPIFSFSFLGSGFDFIVQNESCLVIVLDKSSSLLFSFII